MALCSEYTIFFTSFYTLRELASIDMSILPFDEFCIGDMELARLVNGRLTSVVTSFQVASDPYPRFPKPLKCMLSNCQREGCIADLRYQKDCFGHIITSSIDIPRIRTPRSPTLLRT